MKPQKLTDLDKKVPFTVPEGYFDQLTVSIQERIQEKPRHIWLPQRQLHWAVIAASAALLLVASWVFWPNQEISAEQLLAEVSEQDLIAYLDFQDLSEQELLEGVDSEIIESLWSEDDAMEDLNFDDLDLENILLEYENDINAQES